MTSWVNGAAPSADLWSRVVYGNGHHVTVANTNKGAYSTDGITYTASTLPTTTNSWSGLVFNGAVHVAFDFAGYCCVSSDGGVTWGSLIAMGGATDAWGGIAAKPDGTILCVSQDYANTALSTDNGATWTIGTLPSGGHWIGLVWDDTNGVWITADGTNNANKVYTSPDASTWTAYTFPSAIGNAADIDCDGAGTCIYVSGYGAGEGATTVAMVTTNGGASWTAITMPASEEWCGVRYGGGQWKAIAFHYADAATSTNSGASWTLDATLTIADWFQLGFGNNVFSATGLSSSYANQALIQTFTVPSSGVTVAITGSRSTSKAGAIGSTRTKPVTGARSTTAAGALHAVHTKSVTGERATSAPGTLTPNTGSGAQLTGSRATATPGTVSPGAARALSGTRISSSAGTMTASTSTPVNVPLTGSRATTQPGTVGPRTARLVTGSRATTKMGAISPRTARLLTGSALSSGSGTLIAIAPISVQLTGSRASMNSGLIAKSLVVSTSGSKLISRTGLLASRFYSISPSRLIAWVPPQPNTIVAGYPSSPATTGQPAATLPTTFEQDARDVQDYNVNFNGFLAVAGDSARSAVMTATAGITLSSFTLDQGVVKGWFSGGSVGSTYTIRAVLTTAGGRSKEAEFSVRIRGSST